MLSGRGAAVDRSSLLRRPDEPQAAGSVVGRQELPVANGTISGFDAGVAGDAGHQGAVTLLGGRTGAAP
jgi:hypothetical protein